MLPTAASEKAGLLPGTAPSSDHQLQHADESQHPAYRSPHATSGASPVKLGHLLCGAALLALVGTALSFGVWPGGSRGLSQAAGGGDGAFQLRKTCPVQPKGRISSTSRWPSSYSKDVLQHAADRFARAIRIPTESFPDFGPLGEDARWETRGVFLEYLRSEFPTVYASLDSEIVNVYGTMLTWKGRSDDLAPVLLMAHQDVVPVNQDTIGRWEYPPWDGHLTELSETGWIYGRGTFDCKNLVGIMAALEKLLAEGHEPERTIVIAFGFDEELGGPQGAIPIKEVLLERYGPEAFAFILDEGAQGIDTEYGLSIASLAMTEKGGVQLKVEVETLGGHASVPPKHTGLGYLSILLSHIEANPVKPKFTPTHPLLRYYECAAEYAPDIPKNIKRLIAGDQDDWDVLAQQLADGSDSLRSFLATSRALDIVHGGSKSNALPENAYAIIDTRLGFEDTVEEYHADVTALLLPLVKSLDLTFNAFGSRAFTPAGTSRGNVTVSGEGRNSPPITSSEGQVWEFMAGLVRGVFGEETIATPSGMLGGTDGGRLQILTKHLYRFLPARTSEVQNPHASNEKITLGAHLTTIRFFYELIGNLEGWRE